MKARFFISLVILWLAGSSVLANPAAERIAEIKRAVAMVPIPNWQGLGEIPFGSAFCVDKAGYFITTATLAQAYPNGEVQLVLNPAEKTERTIRAKVIRQDGELNLAILKADDVKDLTSLQIGKTDALYESQSLGGMGAEIGTRQRSNIPVQIPSDCLGIGVSSARIASLWKRNAKLEVIQLDAQLNHGYPGGPLLDSNGAVVGVLQLNPPVKRVTWAVSVDHLVRFLESRATADEPRKEAAAQTQPVEPMAPAVLEDARVTRTMPAAILDVIPAAGGRALLLPLNGLQKIALFDVSRTKVTHYFPVDCNDYVAAAGLEKFVVVDRERNTVHRWDLRTHQKELTADLPRGDHLRIESVAMGYASTGPVMLSLRDHPSVLAPLPVLLDVATLKPLAVQRQSLGFRWQSRQGSALNIRASANGSTFVGWQSEQSPIGISKLVVRGALVASAYEHGGAGLLLPDADGTHILTGEGIYDNKLRRPEARQFRGKQSIPTFDPAFFLTVQLPDPRAVGFGRPEDVKEPPTVELYAVNGLQKVACIEDLDELEDAHVRGAVTHPLPLDKRIHLFPWANLLITVGGPRDQLILRQFKLIEAMDKSGAEYLLVVSPAPARAHRGQLLKYQPKVISKRGGAAIILESGPEGMRLTSAGVLEWQVPAGTSAGPVDVVLSVKDAAGNETFQSFSLPVE